MIDDIKTAVIRNQSTLVQDGLGALAIMVMLWVGLYLPNLV